MEVYGTCCRGMGVGTHSSGRNNVHTSAVFTFVFRLLNIGVRVVIRRLIEFVISKGKILKTYSYCATEFCTSVNVCRERYTKELHPTHVAHRPT